MDMIATGIGVGVLGLAVAALTSGWMLPWLRPYWSPRTYGCLWLGVAVLILMNEAADLLSARPAEAGLVRGLMVLPVLSYVVCAVVITRREWRGEGRSGAASPLRRAHKLTDLLAVYRQRSTKWGGSRDH